MNVKFVDLGRQYQTIKQDVDAAIAGVLERTDFILGDAVKQFEEEFAAYCETPYAVGVDNGTSALELGLLALNIGPGDEVLVPANSFIASASAVSFTGARPVFVDVNPITYNIDVTQIERHISPATKAILVVHLYGQPADMDAVMAIAERHNLYVVEDVAQAHGARYNGRRVGSFGHVAGFSFYPGKNLGAYGDGGAITTSDPAINDRLRVLRNCGQREKYHHVELCYNRRLDTLQAAVLRVKLQHLDNWNAMRREAARLYSQELAASEVITPHVPAEVEPVFHLYVIRTAERDALLRHLSQRGIGVGIHYPIPIHLQPAYANLGYHTGAFPVTEAYASTMLSLPIFAEITPEEIGQVAAEVHAFTQQQFQVVSQAA